jgi:hypothetical protein
MKLLLDPDVDAVFHDAIDVAGTRPEREAIERVQRALTFVDALVRCGETGEHEQQHRAREKFGFHVWLDESGGGAFTEHSPVILSRRSAAKELKLRGSSHMHCILSSFAVFAAQDDGLGHTWNSLTPSYVFGTSQPLIATAS